jgi:hypothetical protein
MRVVVAMFLFVHGFAHFVGFVVPWKIATLDEAPYKTTILADKVDLGHLGIRLIGLLWLLAALGFFAGGALLVGRSPMWQPLTLGTTLFSVVLCLLGLPESRLGIPVNLVILIFVLVGGALGWLSVLGI